MAKLTLDKMRKNSRGRVVDLKGGSEFQRRMDSLGIHTDAVIMKKNAQALRGPINVTVGNTEIAIGHGMASKILVELSGEEK